MKVESLVLGSAAVNVVIVEDDPVHQATLTYFFEGKGYHTQIFTNGKDALAHIDTSKDIQLIILDQNLPGMTGLDIYGALKERNVSAPVIFLSGQSSIPQAVDAIKRGAYDFLTKPVDLDHLDTVVENALLMRSTPYTDPLHEGEISGDYLFITSSPTLASVAQSARTVAALDSPVLLSGETGTGREELARYIHASSDRAKGAFVTVACTFFSEELLAYILFGVGPGVYKESMQSTAGRFEKAHGGVLFLEDVEKINPQLLIDTIDILQNRSYHPIGSSEKVVSDFRLILSINCTRESLGTNGTLPESLFHRLNPSNIHIAPLRNRSSDIPHLTRTMINEINENLGTKVNGISNAALEMLSRWHWPNNCRQLKRILQLIVSLKAKGQITVDDIMACAKMQGINHKDGHNDPAVISFEDVRVNFEKRYLTNAYKCTDGNISLMARLTGISRPSLYGKIDRYNIGK